MRGMRQFLFTSILLIILFCYAMFQGGFVSWFLFFSYIPIFSYHILLIFYPLKKWQLRREIEQQSIYAGDDISVSINIKRKIPFPISFCVVEDILPDSLNKMDHRFQSAKEQPIAYVDRQFKKVIFPWFKQDLVLQFHLKYVPRGEHHLEQIKIKTGDVFGFVTKEHVFKVKNELKVYPRRRKVNISEQMTGIEQGAISAPALNIRSAHIASGIREYAPGDKLSWINWKQTARKNKMMTKEFEQEKSTDTLIVLDSSYHEGKDRLAFEGAVEVAAGLIETLPKRATNIGFLSIGSDIFQVPLYNHPAKVTRIREYLMQVQSTNKKGFPAQLKKELKSSGNEHVVMIITTHMDASLQQTVMWVRQHIKQVFVILVQHSSRIEKREYDMIQSLKYEKIFACVITEKEMKEHMIEVNV